MPQESVDEPSLYEATTVGWISRLFGVRSPKVPQEQTTVAGTLALDLPSDPGATRVPAPRKRGRTTEERKGDWDQYCREMRAKSRAIFERDRRNALAAGSTMYIWRSCGDEDVCAACASKNEKRFAWNSIPIGSHPGQSDCCPSGWCRCYAEALIADVIR
jgi:hypothetical protein